LIDKIRGFDIMRTFNKCFMAEVPFTLCNPDKSGMEGVPDFFEHPNIATLFGKPNAKFEGRKVAELGSECNKLSRHKRELFMKEVGVALDEMELNEVDKKFISRLVEAAVDDSEIIKRVLEMRKKLNADCRLTREEIEELVVKLRCRGFYHVGLDISGMHFEELDLGDAVIGGDFNASDAVIDSGFWQGGARVGGDLVQNRMMVGRNFQQRMVVKGANFQRDLKATTFNEQVGMVVGGDNIQEGMRVAGGNWQNGMSVGGSNFQKGMKVKGKNDQASMVVEGKDERPFVWKTRQKVNELRDSL